MQNCMNINEYVAGWEKVFLPFFNKYVLIENYYRQLTRKMENLVASITPTTFWDVFPQLLGIDARLALLNELVDLLTDDTMELEPEDLINWIEKDYKYYTKELCGFKLNSKTNCSLIFQVV